MEYIPYTGQKKQIAVFIVELDRESIPARIMLEEFGADEELLTLVANAEPADLRIIDAAMASQLQLGALLDDTLALALQAGRLAQIGVGVDLDEQVPSGHRS